MPMDAVCMTAVVRELQAPLVGAKIEKIYQPGRDEVVLSLRGGAGRVRLLLTANPACPRLQLTETERENPASPPMLCMLLRKHLSGGRILSLTQPPLERIAILEMETLDELGDRCRRKLILEAMGRRSNLILVDGEGRIIDCLRRVDAGMSEQRQLLPGLLYRLPPAHGKHNPLEETEESLAALLAGAAGDPRLDGWMLDTFGGLSPLLCREITYRATGETDTRLSQAGETGKARLLEEFSALLEQFRRGDFTPTLLLREGAPKDFSVLPILQYGPAMECRTCTSFSALLDSFYAARDTAQRVQQKGGGMIRSVTTLRDRTARRLERQRKELAATENREWLRQQGDIITSNLYQMGRGMKTLRAVNYYDETGAEVSIPLDPLLTPQQNAASYYKRYNKAKTAHRVLQEQLETGKKELDYLESVLETLHRAEGERDLNEIRQELEDAGYLRRKKQSGKKEKRPVSKPLEFQTAAGLRISVGRNNLQNDRLTCKLAHKSDLWFHVQGIHGAHVILWTEGRQPDGESMSRAARLAAYYSQGREGHNIPVDYTQVRYVKKPAGARPGMVIYTTYSTSWVTPEGP